MLPSEILVAYWRICITVNTTAMQGVIMVSDRKKTADERIAEQFNTSERIRAYQKLCEHELPGNPSMVFVGIFMAFLTFCVLGSLPWVMSYLQDEGIIHPRIHLRNFGPQRYQLPEYDQERTLHVAPGHTNVFNRPRDRR
jgi:hypothetical protein